MRIEQKITPCLWFDANAGEAVDFYRSVFPDSAILATSRYGKEGPGPEGAVLTIRFSLEGQAFLALNGGPHFSFSPAVSLVVNCRDQAEVDRLWEALPDGGGETQMCGWLRDRFGLSWQIVPEELEDLMQSPDEAAKSRVMQALLQMRKLDVSALRAAAAG